MINIDDGLVPILHIPEDVHSSTIESHNVYAEDKVACIKVLDENSSKSPENTDANQLEHNLKEENSFLQASDRTDPDRL